MKPVGYRLWSLTDMPIFNDMFIANVIINLLFTVSKLHFLHLWKGDDDTKFMFNKTFNTMLGEYSGIVSCFHEN